MPLGQAKIAVLDLAGNYDKISKVALERIRPDLAAMGLALTTFYIENISLPPEVEQALDKRTQMGVLGNLDQYAKYQTANAIPDAAKNPGGLAGAGMGLAAGVAMGGQMAGALAGATQPTAAPPPLPQSGFFVGIGGQQQGPFDVAVPGRTGARRVADAHHAGVAAGDGQLGRRRDGARIAAAVRRRAAAAAEVMGIIRALIYRFAKRLIRARLTLCSRGHLHGDGGAERLERLEYQHAPQHALQQGERQPAPQVRHLERRRCRLWTRCSTNRPNRRCSWRALKRPVGAGAGCAPSQRRHGTSRLDQYSTS